MSVDNRPSKKQQILLSFIDGFIKNTGYGPSYREIMRALGYKSVSTVAVHVDSLIACGLLSKKDNSARSLEVVRPIAIQDNDHTKWLKREIKKRQSLQTKQGDDDAAVLSRALVILLDQTTE